MSVLKIALLQMVSCENDQDANLSKGIDFCRRAHNMGADIALFPEMWNIGYTSYDPKKPNARETFFSGLPPDSGVTDSRIDAGSPGAPGA